ncbi:MAG: glycosyltransferase family 1 protein [Bacteroidota bacterium]
MIKGKLEGLGWHNYELCKALVEAHPEDEFIFFFDRPFDDSFLFGDKVRGVVVAPPARHPILWWIWFEVSLPLYLKRYQIDVFLSLDSYCSLRSQVSTLMVTHDIAHVHYPDQVPAWPLRFYKKYVPKYLKRADHIITVSHFVKEDIITQYQIPAEKISVATNALRGTFKPVDENARVQVRQQYAAGTEYFFYLGAIHPRKNIDRLIQAFDQFKSKTQASTKLLIGGRFAWQTGAIKTAYDQSPYQDDIQFLGYLPDQELKQIMASALALTYVSLFEGFGFPILEAMHCEVPVITSNTSSMPEVAGEAALLVDPESIDEIAKAMQDLYLLPQLRYDLVEKGRRQRERFSWKKTADIVYEQLKAIE